MRGSVSAYDTKKGKRWYFVFPVAGKAFKRGGFSTRKAALAAMQHELVRRRSDGWIEPSSMPMPAYLDRWLDDVGPALAPSTRNNYRVHLAHLKRCLTGVTLGGITAPVIQGCYREMEQTRAATTLTVTHAVLHGALKQSVRWRLRHDNPADYVTTPTGVAKEEVVWTAEQAQRFLAENADSPSIALWRVLLGTGMRLGEALGLNWAAVDLERGTVRIQRTLTTDAERQVVIAERVKSKASRRTLDLSAETVAALRTHKAHQNRRRLAHDDWHDAGLVFDRHDGRFLNPCVVRARLVVDCEQADVPVLTPKALRHTAGTQMALAGVPLHAIMGILGHSSITITASLYAHYSQEATKRGLDALAKVLEG